MNIIRRGYGYTCNFTCPYCGSELEAETDELQTRLGDAVVKFNCPVCDKQRSINRKQINKKYRTYPKEET